MSDVMWMGNKVYRPSGPTSKHHSKPHTCIKQTEPHTSKKQLGNEIISKDSKPRKEKYLKHRDF